MSKHFVMTANNTFINLDFVTSIYYREHIYDIGSTYEIILEGVEGEVSFGYVLREAIALNIIGRIINEEPIYNECYGVEEIIDLLKANGKKSFITIEEANRPD